MHSLVLFSEVAVNKQGSHFSFEVLLDLWLNLDFFVLSVCLLSEVKWTRWELQNINCTFNTTNVNFFIWSKSVAPAGNALSLNTKTAVTINKDLPERDLKTVNVAAVDEHTDRTLFSHRSSPLWTCRLPDWTAICLVGQTQRLTFLKYPLFSSSP